MSDLIDEMGRGLLGRATVNDASPMTAILAELVTAGGSGKGAARLMGVSDTTFYRWRNYATKAERGIRQKPPEKRVLVAAIRKAGLTPELRKKITSKQISMKIRGMVVMSDDTRERTIHPGQYIPGQKMGILLSAWTSGDDERTDRLLNKYLDQHYAEGIEFDRIDWVRFE